MNLDDLRAGATLKYIGRSNSLYTNGQCYEIESLRGPHSFYLDDDTTGGHAWGYYALITKFELVPREGEETMTETQKAVEAKLLTEILEEKDQSDRWRRVEEYHEFARACQVLKSTKLMEGPK